MDIALFGVAAGIVFGAGDSPAAIEDGLSGTQARSASHRQGGRRYEVDLENVAIVGVWVAMVVLLVV